MATVNICSSYTMPTRDVSRIHEAIINIPEGGARGNHTMPTWESHHAYLGCIA